jgi:hypothetical protein
MLAALAAPGMPMAATAGIAPATGHVPKRYLCTMVDEAFLGRHLLPADSWRPYPKAAERAGWRGVPADIVAEVTGRADGWIDAEWPQLPASLFLEFRENGNRTRYEKRYFERRKRLAGLVLAECLQGQGRYLRVIADGVWHVCEEGFWGLPAHSGMQRSGVGLPDVGDPVIDLFAAETGVTLAYVHYLLGAELAAMSPLLPARIVLEVKRRILDPGWLRDDFKWMGLKEHGEPLNNWTSWIASSWLEANLVLEPDAARRIAATLKICGCLDRFLRDYSDVGACEEGPGYWALSAGPYLDALVALESATGGQLALAGDPFVRRMGRYVLDVHVADDWYVNYGDAHAKVRHSPQLLYRFGLATGERDMMAFGAFRAPATGIELSGQGRLARDIPNLLQAAALRTQAKADALVRSSWYPALGLMTARARQGSKEGFYVAVQAAANARSHGHHDSGSFIVFHDGAPVFVDPGVEAYTAKTFGPERYGIWTMRSGYHNLPLVDGRMQEGGERHRASRLEVKDDAGAASMSMELATAYGADAGIERWRRTVVLDRKAGTVGVREAFALSREAPVALVFMTPRVPEEGSPGTLRLALENTRPVELRFDAGLLQVRIERLPLDDPGLRREWGNSLYRVELVALRPLARGNLAITVALGAGPPVRTAAMDE